MKYSQSSINIIRISIIRSFWDQNLVRPSIADNSGLTVLGFIYRRLPQEQGYASKRSGRM